MVLVMITNPCIGLSQAVLMPLVLGWIAGITAAITPNAKQGFGIFFAENIFMIKPPVSGESSRG